MKRKLTSILAMDVVGYSRSVERDEGGTVRRLKDVRAQVCDPLIASYFGKTIKLMGDGMLIEFASVVDGLNCGVEIQTAIRSRNEILPKDHRLEFRAGLHLGDVLVDGDEIYGDGVNVAARLEQLAPTGGLVFSRQVHDQVDGVVTANFLNLGEQPVKGIARPIEAFQVVMDPIAPMIAQTGFCFDAFELDPDLFELRKDGKPVVLEPRALELLLLLVQNAGRLVTKDEIFARVWDNRIVSDSALSSQVKAARKAVGDDGASQSIIATVHGRGFKFVAPLLTPEAPPSETAEAAQVPTLNTRPSVAILPFKNMNRDPDEDYLADGITEDITIALARNRWLTVIARSPAFSFRNSAERLRKIGQELQAQYLVTGTVRKAGSRYRIGVEVVDAATELSIWSERFDRDGMEIFDLQDDISDLVASRIESELGLAEQAKAKRVPRQNQGAWESYQLGVAEFYKFTPEANQRSQEYLQRALEIDPQFAAACSRLAYAIILSMIYFDAKADQQKMDTALELAKRGIELDDQEANAHFTIGRVHLARKEYGLAIEALEHALDLNPCLAVTYCGLGDSLAYEGRLDEAITQFESAIRLSPHDPFRWAFYSYRSLAHLFQGDYQAAAAWARRSQRIPNAQYWAHAHLASALGYMGDKEEIEAARQNLLRIKPDFTIKFAQEQLFYLKLPGQMATYLEGLRRAGLPGGE
ncbi:winged helix-turn-helix domain-containing protein [Ruegeria sp. 2012CJ41-6]|uniref:Winged helix-turn-helix domain-containing protein n=1 Tax=Ruegeria spongiae TaxID=2942209 RepID=A0ABT0Q989_9RHOB|nr:winged helix-turn-helix domain-containing protein [Ruegeria spongiae]MCL6285748.1 winged helix-turn-helix domain-containing protein [Ruegeria spongiae]